jgi:hypothetical protein
MYGFIKKEDWGKAIGLSMLISVTFSSMEEKRGA